VVVCSREWSGGGPEFVQDRWEIFGVGGYPCIEFRNGNVSDFHLFPSLCFVRLEYFVERLFQNAIGGQTLLIVWAWLSSNARTFLSPSMLKDLFLS
jgi:hypothetical protein